MKKRLLILATIVVGLGLAACSTDSSGLEDAADEMKKELSEGTDKAEETTDAAEKTESTPKGDVSYQCPDDCDNGPVYSKPGPCNKCGKEMVLF